VRGRVELLQSLSLAVVGTRRPTPYGLAAAERLSADLAHAGLAIVSGMARGIDTAAHEASLQASGGTIAVFGCGLDLIYPTENRKLAARIALDIALPTAGKGRSLAGAPRPAPATTTPPCFFPPKEPSRIRSGAPAPLPASSACFEPTV